MFYRDFTVHFFPLKQFSFDIAEKAAHVCLAHLFTYQDFDMGTLGLAYVGSPRPNSHGGICPKGKTSFSSFPIVGRKLLFFFFVTCI